MRTLRIATTLAFAVLIGGAGGTTPSRAEMQRDARSEAKPQIPPELQFRCFLMTSPQTQDPEINEKRYRACLRDEWKRWMGNTPFPGD